MRFFLDILDIVLLSHKYTLLLKYHYSQHDTASRLWDSNNSRIFISALKFFFSPSWIKCVGFPLNDIENWHWPAIGFFKTCFYVVWFLSKSICPSPKICIYFTFYNFSHQLLCGHNRRLNFFHEDVQRLFVWCYLLWYISIFLILLGGMHGLALYNLCIST